MRTAKLVIGIVSMVLFIFICFQSCAVGISNAILENGERSGAGGIVLAFLMLTAGIIGVATRNGGKGGGITAGVFYLFSGLVGITNVGNTFTDLAIWSWLCFVFGTVFIVGSILERSKINQMHFTQYNPNQYNPNQYNPNQYNPNQPPLNQNDPNTPKY